MNVAAAMQAAFNAQKKRDLRRLTWLSWLDDYLRAPGAVSAIRHGQGLMITILQNAGAINASDAGDLITRYAL